MCSIEDLEEAFPHLQGTAYSEESEETDAYNCIAYAFGDVQNWWWPRRGYGYYWPPGFPLEDSVDVLVTIFEVHGYGQCETADAVIGYEKIAIYSVDGRITHAARQLRSGRWASKLGTEQDIEHERTEHINNKDYGVATRFLQRKRKDWE